MDEPVYLRALEASDLDRICLWHNDRDLFEKLGGPFHFFSRKAVESWLDRKTTFATDELSLAMCVRETDRHVGNIYLRQINWINRHAELLILIGDPQERSKGYGKSAVRQLLAYSFKDLGLKTIYLHVLGDNLPAIRAYERNGFQVEGTLRNRIFKQGVWKDLIVMSVCAD